MSPMLVESPRLQSSSVTGSSLRLIALGGLAWSASLRGWMTQLAGTESSFTWTGTFLHVLLPGVLVGGLLGWAEALRQSCGHRRWRWVALAPALFIIALTDPQNFTALIQTGMGWSPRRSFGWTARRLRARSSRAGLVTGRSRDLRHGRHRGSGFMTSDVHPIATAHGAWAAVYLPSLLLVLWLACSIPHRPLPDRPDVMITRGEADAR